jgi:signal peptidase II
MEWQPGRGAVLGGGRPLNAAARSTRRRLVVILVTAAAIFGLDHLTKWLVVSNVPLLDEVPAGSPVTIHHIENSGAAFGLFPQFKGLYLVVAGLVGVYILVVGPRLEGSILRQVILGGILGGALSNGVDRLLLGHVTDFIDFHFWLFQVFNVADMAIVGGMLITVATLTFGGKRPESAEQAGSES